MTKGDLLDFLAPFTDDVELINGFGETIIATYIMNSDKEGMVVLGSLEDQRKAVQEPMRHKF